MSGEISGVDLLPAAEDYNPNTTLPVILHEPRAAYATKEKAAKLYCKAAHAQELRFTCNEEAMPAVNETEAVDAGTGVMFREVWIEVGPVLESFYRSNSAKRINLIH